VPLWLLAPAVGGPSDVAAKRSTTFVLAAIGATLGAAPVTALALRRETRKHYITGAPYSIARGALLYVLFAMLGSGVSHIFRGFEAHIWSAAASAVFYVGWGLGFLSWWSLASREFEGY